MSKLEDKLSQLSPQQRAKLAKRLRTKRRQTTTVTDRHTAKLQLAKRNEAQPLSSAQQRLWFLEQLEPDSRAFHITSAVWLEGTIEPEILKEAFLLVTERHEALRTTFHSANGIPFQKTTQQAHQPLQVTTDLVRDVQTTISDHHIQSFSLETGPLMRATLILDLSPQSPRHLLIVTIHHIIADFGSIGVLFHELRQAYESLHSKQPANLPTLPVQYIDYALWERSWILDSMRESLLEYWQDRIQSAPNYLDFPTDFPRPEQSSEKGRRFSFELPASIHKELQEICQASGATMFVLLQTAYAICLHQHSEQCDFVIGTVVANRTRPEFENLIGFFANTLPLRFKFTPGMTIGELLQTTRQRSLELLDHQELSLDRLVEALNVPRHPNQSPIFQYTFDFLASAISDTGFPGVTIEPIDIDLAPTKYDLMLSMQDRGGTIRGAFTYKESLFKPETIERLSQRFKALLGSITSPDLRLESLPRMGEAEAKLVSHTWSGQGTEIKESGPTIVDLFEKQVQALPHAIAVRFGSNQWSYQSLNHRVNVIAQALVESDFTPEAPIAVSLNRSLDLIAAPLAIMRVGGTYLPLDPSYPQDRLEFMLRDSGSQILVTEETLQLRFTQTKFNGRVLLIESLRNKLHESEHGKSKVLRSVKKPIPSQQAAYLIYTSGSTGRPKGCVVSHGAYANTFFQQKAVFGVSSHDHVLQFANSSFDASVFESGMALLSGACLTMVSESDIADPVNFTRYVTEQEVTIATLPPSFLKALDGASLPSLRILLTAGERADPELAVSYGKTSRSFNLYGPTEASVWSTFFEITAETSLASEIPIGSPIANTSCFVRDTRDALCPIGIEGELVLGGLGLARGYLNRPDLTAERFVPNPHTDLAGSRLYRTGDLARWNPLGTLDFLGRNDRQVKIRGRRIEIGEIEWAAKRCPLVNHVAVVPHVVDNQDDRLILYWSLLQRDTENGTIDVSQQLKEYMSGLLPSYMIPNQFIRIDQLPFTPNGKVDTRQLPSPDQGDSNQIQSSKAVALDPITDGMLPIWSDLLGRKNIAPGSDFFDLGGHSLLAVQLSSRIQNVFNVELSVRDIFETPVLQDLSRMVYHRKTGVESREQHSDPIIPLPNAARFPLSHSQRRLWFLHELEGPVAAYNLFGALRIVGDLNPDTISKAFQAMIARQESLRLGFATDNDGEPYAFLRPVSLFQIQCINLEDTSTEACNTQIAKLVGQPFDLTKDPLIRLILIKRADQETLMIVNMHHAISDGWSVEIFLREFAELFSATHENRPPSLAPLDVQFSDCSAWLAKADRLASIDYWTETLKGAPDLLELPTDHTRPRRQSYRGGSSMSDISKELSAKIDSLCKQTSSTHFTFFQSALAVFLSRLARQSDLVIGSVVANRPRSEMESLIGFFANTLAYRFDLSDNPSFETLVKRSKDAFLASIPHQDAPFESIIDRLQPERNQAHSPIFQVLLVVQNMPAPLAALGNFEVGFHPIPSQTSKFDLTLFVEPRTDGLQLRWEFASDLFLPETIERFSDDFATLLEQITLHPNIPAGQLRMVSQGERQAQAAWNATAVNFGTAQTIIELFEEQAVRHPNRIALQFSEQSLTYRQLDQRSNQLAHLLRHQGVQTEELVGVYAERSLDLVIALYGIMKAGAAYVPIDPEYPADRIQYMIQDSGTRVLLTQEKLMLQSKNYLPEGRKCSTIALDTDWHSALSEDSIQPPHRHLDMKGLAYMIYTSGSTGRPKGATNTHEAILNRLLWMQQAYQLDHTDCVLQKTPFSFDVSVWEFFWPMIVGSKLSIAEPGGHRDTNYLIDVIRRNNITTLHFVPPMLQAFVEDPDVTDCSPLKRVICSGEALPGDLRDRFVKLLDSELHNLYGPTEAAIDVSFWDCRRETENPVIPIGHPISNTELPILDPNLEPLPAGAPGELMIGGTNLARGYHARPDLTADRFIPNVFATHENAGSRLYRTGDLTRFRNNGCIEFLGRLDNQVKIRGLRIELGEIETVYGSHPQIHEIVVLVREDHPGHRRIVAYLVSPSVGPNNEASFIEELQKLSGTKLPDYMMPSAFVFIESLPLTPNGKIDRRALPLPKTPSDNSPKATHRPLTPVETQLANIWASLLGVNPIGPEDNFFHLGGDSIQSIQVVSRARSDGLMLTVRDLFEGQTLGAIASRTTTAIVSRIDQGPVSGPVQLTPIQRWFSLLPIKNRNHWNQGLALRLAKGVDLKRVNRAIEQLCFHHDQLRARFECSDHSIEQTVAPPNLATSLSRETRTISDTSEPSIAEALQQLHQRLNLESGPVFGATYLTDAESHQSWLLLAAHHLVIDGVSWRILMEDLSTAYEQLTEGQSIKLPNKTTAYQDWATQINGPNIVDEAKNDLVYWQAQIEADQPPKIEEAGSSSTSTSSLEGQVVTTRIEIPSETSRFIARELTNKTNLRVQEFLIAALAMAWQQVNGESRFTFDIEGHGRSLPTKEGLDVSRTVGWFTSIYPVSIRPCGDATPAEFLAEIKDTIAQIPSDGISYGILQNAGLLPRATSPEILFNYLGQVETKKQGTLIAGFESIEKVFARDPESPRPYPIDVSVAINDGQLVIHWSHNPTPEATTRSKKLSNEFAKAIDALATACQALPRKIRVPSDFPLAKLSATDLTGLEARMPTFDDVLPLTPMQAGILFHTQFNRDSGSYIQQLGFSLTGNLSTERLKRAWETTLGRHEALRGFFAIDEVESPLQLISHHTLISWTEHDWRELSREDFNAKLDAYTRDDRQRGLDVSAPPLMRFHLIQKSPRDSVLLWTHHHLLLDGWSIPIVVNEVLQYYNRTELDAPLPKRPRQFKDYLHWLNLQDDTEANRFWSGELAQYQQETRIPFVAPRNETEEAAATSELTDSLSPLLTGALKTLAKKEHVTMSCLAQAGWAILLAGANPDQPIVFGATVSGRPASLDGVESIVGLFINTIPICVATDTEEPTLEWMRSIHKKQAERERNSFVPLARLSQFSSLPARSPLFESVLVYENFPIEQQSSKDPETLSVTGLEVREKTSFPVTLILGESDQLHLRLLFDENRISKTNARAILKRFSKILESLFDFTHRPVGEIFKCFQSIPPQATSDREKHEQTSDPQPPARPSSTHSTFPAESILQDVWSSVLGISNIAPQDDFFDLGGDSILSLQIVSRLSKQGLKISVKDVFEYPTIHSLAKRLTSESSTTINQATVKGSVELSPVQHWFFSLQHENRSHWNQSILFELGDQLNQKALEQALQKLLTHHDLLRGIFTSSSDEGPHSLFIPELAVPVSVHIVVLEETLSDRDRAHQIQEQCDAAQKSLRIDKGENIRVVYFKTGNQANDRLLIVSHHLVIDGVSWRILIDDLNLAYDESVRGIRSPQLPLKTNSYQEWTHDTHSNLATIEQGESSYWNSLLVDESRQGGRCVAISKNAGNNRETDTITLHNEMSESTTETLSRLATSGPFGNIETLLLAALSHATFTTFEGDTLFIDVESHGRSNKDCDLDLSRTIGWFTAIYPIAAHRIPDGKWDQYAAQINEMKQAIPRDGSGYAVLQYLKPESLSETARARNSDVLFNYLGRTSSGLSNNGFFNPVDEPSGQTRSPMTERSHALCLDCIIRDGRLRISFGFSPQRCSAESIKHLSDRFLTLIDNIQEFTNRDQSEPPPLIPDTSLIEDVMLGDILDELED